MEIKEKGCKCGKTHINPVDKILVGKGVLAKLCELVNEYGKKAFILSDSNTFEVAGKKVCEILKNDGINYTSYVLKGDIIEPDEKSVGSVFMH